MSDQAESDPIDPGNLADMELHVLRQKESVYVRAITTLEHRMDAMDKHMTECMITARVSDFIYFSHGLSQKTSKKIIQKTRT